MEWWEVELTLVYLTRKGRLDSILPIIGSERMPTGNTLVISMRLIMKKYLVSSILVAVVLAVALPFATAGVVWGKAHVPAGQVQVSHKGRTAETVDAPALKAHIRHGDIQLPACDFNNVFIQGNDTSNVVSSDFTGVTYSDFGFIPREDAGGITPACPAGTF